MTSYSTCVGKREFGIFQLRNHHFQSNARFSYRGGALLKYLFLLLFTIAAISLADSQLSVSSLDYTDHGNSGSFLQGGFSVQVTSTGSGAPVQNCPVHFTVQQGDGELNPSSGFYTIEEESADGFIVHTDEEGIASVDLELGKMGEVSVTASVTDSAGVPAAVSFDVVSLDIRAIIFQIAGGLAVFLLGMQLMSSSLQQVAGNRMRTILKALTSNRFMGVAAGALVTALVQSSSATTVITVGFVNSSLMTLQQAVGVILGANIGTTITGQLIAFKATSYAFPMIAIGFAFATFSKNSRRQMWGRALMGLGLLFLGMTTMAGVMKPLRGSAPVREFFTTFSTNPILAIIAGTLVTVIVQSSSATVGLTMTLAGSGLIGLQGAIFLVLGDNIGTTITAQLASIGSSRAARQTAMAHTLFNLFGAIYFALLAIDRNGFFLNLVRRSSGDAMRQVANAHTIFNIVNCIVFLPLVPLLTKLCKLILPTGEEELESSHPELHLDTNLLDSPTLAMDTLNREMAVMARFAGKGLIWGAEHFLFGKHNSKKIMAMEDSVDDMQRDMTVYATKLFKNNLSDEQALMIPVILHSINDIERVSDHAVNMVEARARVQGNILEDEGPLSSAAGQALKVIRKMVVNIVQALENHDLDAAQKVLELEGRLNLIEEEARNNYGNSLATYGVSNLAGLAILDFIEYCERAGDHIKNIAQSIVGGGIWHGEEPGD